MHVLVDLEQNDGDTGHCLGMSHEMNPWLMVECKEPLLLVLLSQKQEQKGNQNEEKEDS
jgi:hypothetical protein